MVDSIGRTPAPSIRAESLHPDSDIISIADSHRPLTSSSPFTSITPRRRSSSLWQNRRFSVTLSKIKSSSAQTSANSIAIEPHDIPTLDGKITQASLERTSALLLTEPIKLASANAKNPGKYDFMGKVESLYQQTMLTILGGSNDVDIELEIRFTNAVERHRKNANDTSARQEFKALAETGHISGMIMYGASLRYRHDTKSALLYLYVAARILITQLANSDAVHAWSSDTLAAKDEELRLALSEIARTFMYPGGRDTLSPADARAFYAAGADVGDWQGMYQLGGCYLYGEGGEKKCEIGRLLIARSKGMRNEV